MPSSILTRFTISVAGAPLVFGQPFATPTLTLEEDPSVYVVQLAASATGTLWNGDPLPTTFDTFAATADQDCDLEFVVDGGAGDEFHFTLFLRGGGYPLLLCGDDSYAGQSGTQDSFTSGTLKAITKINAKNRNTTTVCNISILIGKAAT